MAPIIMLERMSAMEGDLPAMFFRLMSLLSEDEARLVAKHVRGEGKDDEAEWFGFMDSVEWDELECDNCPDEHTCIHYYTDMRDCDY